MKKLSKSKTPKHLIVGDGATLELEPETAGNKRGMLLLSVTDDEGPDGEVVWACIYVTATQLEEMAHIARSWDPK